MTPLYAASFDCNKATTETEKAICVDDYLGSLDKKMANLWKKNPRSDHEILEQKKWLKERDRFLNEPHCKPNNRCLRDDYRFRILELETDCSIEIDVSNLNDGNYPLVELEDVISVSDSFEECRRQSLSKNIDDFEKFSDIFLSISDETCAIAVDAFMYPISERVGHSIMSRCGSDIADLYGLLLDAMVALIKKQNPDFSVSFSEDELRWRSFTEESCEFYSDQFGSDSYRNIDGINQCRRDVLKFRILYLSPLIGVEDNRGWPANSIEEVLGPYYGLYRK